MKGWLLFCCFLSLMPNSVFAQSHSIDRELPPFEELPKSGEVKTFYEFELDTDYKLYNSKGELIKQGYSKFVDITDYAPGKYVFKFDGKEVIYEHSNELFSSNSKPGSKSFEFDRNYDYKLYDLNGNLLERGNKKVVDLSAYPPGVYFFDYNGIKVPYKLEAN